MFLLLSFMKMRLRQSESTNQRRTENTMTNGKRTKGITTIHRKIIIEQQEPHQISVFHIIIYIITNIINVSCAL